jgi:uncharacterized RDD family membrane protein YckC
MAELEGAPLASFISRAAAFVIDAILAAVAYVAAGILLALAKGQERIAVDFNPFQHENFYSLIFYVVFIALSNYIGNGQTIGKRFLGIRAVSLVHKRLSLWHSVERALGYGASMLEGGFGFVQYFVHQDRRTVHDRIAETIVVSESKRR